jgi:hypothetical protein
MAGPRLGAMSVALESSLALSGVRTTRLKSVEWCLRIGAAACFIGHGAFGVLMKEAWVSYFAVVGIDRDLAYVLMPIVGWIDIAAGMLVLLSPRPAVLLYMTIWATWTALLRPLAGETFFETLERAGNYGVPLALLWVYATPTSLREVFAPVRSRPIVDRLVIGRILLGTTAVLLFAHGALQAIARKPLFATHYAAIDVPMSIAPVIGTIEMGVALLVLVAPLPALLIAIALWKVATESLFPIAGTPIWELVERGGSYAAPLALVLLLGTSPFTRINLSRSTR